MRQHRGVLELEPLARKVERGEVPLGGVACLGLGLFSPLPPVASSVDSSDDAEDDDEQTDE